MHFGGLDPPFRPEPRHQVSRSNLEAPGADDGHHEPHLLFVRPFRHDDVTALKLEPAGSANFCCSQLPW